MAISTIKQAISQEVKVTSMSHKNICELLIVLKDQQSISQQSVIDLSKITIIFSLYFSNIFRMPAIRIS